MYLNFGVPLALTIIGIGFVALIALIFVVFEVEVAFVYPIAAVYLDWVRSGRRLYALSEILIFLLILFVGLVYVWVKHDLEWIKKVPVEN
jgi:NADH-quinone oxidoreductase subunit A